MRAASQDLITRLRARPAPNIIPPEIEQEAANLIEKLEIERLEERAKGRAEALALILDLDAERGLEDFVGWSPNTDAGDHSGFWDRPKLQGFFKISDAQFEMMDKAEEEYWHNLGLRHEAKHLYKKAKALQEKAEENLTSEEVEAMPVMADANGNNLYSERSLKFLQLERDQLRQAVIKAARVPGPICRDCADSIGLCLHSGEKCDPFEAALDILRNHKQLNNNQTQEKA